MLTYLAPDAPECTRLNELRAELDDLAERLDALTEAPLPPAEAAARYSQALERRRAVARTRLGYFTHASQAPAPDDADIGAMLAEILGPELDKKIEKYFAARAADNAVSLTDRAKLRTQLEQRRRETLLAEEREACRLEAEGFSVVRRPLVDVEVILEAWDID